MRARWTAGRRVILCVCVYALFVAAPFTYAAMGPPSISGLWPASGSVAGGTPVTIAGLGFATSGTVGVMFGSNPGTSVTVNSATQITCTTPAGSAVAVDLVVTNPDSQSATMTGAFTYVAPLPYAWGGNSNGQLGDGTTTGHNTPAQVTGLSGVTAVAGGWLHSMALKNDGTVSSWGYNQQGQVGDGTFTQRNTPVQVSGLGGVTAVAAGYWHSLALKNDGTVWAWGNNTYGQLGAGGFESTTPVQVTGLSGVTAIATGWFHSLALKNDGTVWAWGRNMFGQLGDGTTTSRNTAAAVTGLSGITAITGGEDYSLALKNDGTAWAWGANYNGQLGVDNGTTPRSLTPVRVAGLSGVTAIAGGAQHCLALKNDGTVWAWGGGNSTPVQLMTGPPAPTAFVATAIAAGYWQSLALKSDGMVWAWGDNSSDTPVLVAGLSGVTAIAGGYDHSLAVGLLTGPTITSLTPANGPDTGGTPVTITGTNFATVGTVSVTFGSNAATSVTVNSATQITCTSPAGNAGAADVVVTNPNLQSTTKTGAFTYINTTYITVANGPWTSPSTWMPSDGYPTSSWRAIVTSYAVTLPSPQAAQWLRFQGQGTVGAPGDGQTIAIGQGGDNPPGIIDTQPSGLQGKYYNSPNMIGSNGSTEPSFSDAGCVFVLSRADSTINYLPAWPNPPALGVNNTRFMVMWDGYIMPSFTEAYTFYTKSDDGIRSYLGQPSDTGTWWNTGNILTNQWVDRAVPGNWDTSTAKNLTAGVRYPIHVEFYQRDGGSGAGMLWSSPSMPQAYIVASSAFVGTISADYLTFAPATDGTLRGAINVQVAGGSLVINSNILGNYNGIDGLRYNGSPGNTLTLNGASTYTGYTTFGGGTLVLGNAQALGGSTLCLLSTVSTPCILTTSSAMTIANAWSLGGNMTLASPYAMTYSGAVTLTGNPIITVSTSALQKLNGVISGSGSLGLAGTGALALSAANTYTGGTAISGGTLLANNTTGSATGAGAVQISGASAGSAFLRGTGTITGAITAGTSAPLYGTVWPGATGATPVATDAKAYLRAKSADFSNNGTLIIRGSNSAPDTAPVCDKLILTGNSKPLVLGGSPGSTLLVYAHRTNGSYSANRDTAIVDTPGNFITSAFSTVTIYNDAGLTTPICVVYTNAAGNEIATPSAGTPARQVRLRFNLTLQITTRETLDTDGNGKIDAIRIVANAPLNDNFTGLQITVNGYQLAASPYDTGTGANDNEFFVRLQEGTVPDTGAKPGVQVVAAGGLARQDTGEPLPVDAAPVTSTDKAKPVLMAALWVEGSAGGVSPNDPIYLTFSEPVTSNSALAGDFGLPVSQDSFGAGATVSGTGDPKVLAITLGTNPLLTPGGLYGPGATTPGCPTGIFVDAGTNIADNSPAHNTALVQTIDTAKDLQPGNEKVSICWADDLSIAPKNWNIGLSDGGATYQAFDYFQPRGLPNGLVARNNGNVREKFTVSCSSSSPAAWTVATDAGLGPNRFELKASNSGPPYTTYPLDLGTGAKDLATQLYSGHNQAFDLQFRLPTAVTSDAGVGQAIAVTITAAKD